MRAAQGRVRGSGWGTLALAASLTAVIPALAEPNLPEKAKGRAAEPVLDPMASDAMRSDAALWDVSFIDKDRGWAVGDRGTIRYTEDGGRHWGLQESGVSCRLESVSFLGAETGWAAGGYSHPYLHTGTGVLLFTRDGGRHWNRDAKVLLPVLKRVRFFSPREGWALGAPSAMFPSGIFTTDTGGRSWSCFAGPRTAGWVAGDFLGPQIAALADRSGGVVAVRSGAIRPADVPDFAPRRLTRLKLTPPSGGWLVGQGGLILRTANQGAGWEPPPGDLTSLAPDHFDFAALEVRGPKCWIAGSPGTRVFFTPDAGRSWSAASTGQNAPISALWFADDRNGWAVGQFGTILATGDGGQTWKVQRAGGSRAALLGVFAEPEDIPWEPLVRLCGNEGYLGVVEIIARRDVEVPPRDEVSLADRVHEALIRVGACGARTAWQFPLRQPGLAVPESQVRRVWDQIHHGHGLDELEFHLVRQIRTWRPEVIVTSDAAGRPDDSIGRLLHRAVLQAVSKAADSAAYPRQIAPVGLEPWQVKRAYAALPPGVAGAAQVTAAQLADRLGASLGDLAVHARGLVHDRFRPGPESLAFQVLFDESPGNEGRGDFFSGASLRPGGEARRPWVEPSGESMELIRRTAQKRRSVQAIVARGGEDPRSGAALLAQVQELTRGLDPDGAAEILFQLAETYRRSGHWPAAAEVMELLAERHPEHPLARPALRWLVQYYASGEAAWRVQGPRATAVRQASLLRPEASRHETRLERAVALAGRLQQTRPDLFADPAIGFSLAAANRRRGQPDPAERFYDGQRRSIARDIWWACAQGEQWLAAPKGPPPKAVLHCRAAAARPRLDGRLDEPTWKAAEPAALASPLHDDAEWPAEVLLSYDREFLYLAIRARQAPGGPYEPTPGPRPRDADLSARDRVELLLDIDRDFSTYYRLAVDSRGWTAEDCWEDATWNPSWFVAADSGDGAWTAEAAIGWDQLTGEPPGLKTVWAIGIQRIVPRTGFQSWNAPAAVQVIPEGFGYLVFDSTAQPPIPGP